MISPQVGRRLGVLLVLACAVVVAVALLPPQRVAVVPGTDIGALATAQPGADLQLAPGLYDPFTLTVPATVRGGPGVRVRGPVVVLADGVRLQDMAIEGGATGIEIQGVDDVTLERVTVQGAALHGIEVVAASATITDCRITALRDAFAQGIEVRNAAGRGRTIVSGCTVDSGQEGIVAHVSRVEFLNNAVSGTTMRAITVTEMSEGVMAGNTVADVTGSGLYCGDMSHCEVRDNVVRAVSDDGSGIRSRSGQAAIAWFHSSMRLTDNRFDAVSTAGIDVYSASYLTDEWPLAIWPPGWRGAAGAGLVTIALSLGGLALLSWGVGGLLRRRAVGRWSGRLPRRGVSGRSRAAVDMGAAAALLGAFAIQTFHMGEHAIQVWQAHVAQSPRHDGLLGAVADGEWVHWLFNIAVLTFLVVAWRDGRRPDGVLHGSGAAGRAGVLGGVLVIQSYHVVEHSVRVVQFLATGLDPAPGLIAGRVNPVWFHFGVNLAVWVGTAIAVGLPLLRQVTARGAAPTPVRVDSRTPCLPQSTRTG